MPQYFKDLGEDLVRHGYRIVPLPPGSKGPRMKGWPQANLSVEDVRRMAANGSAQAGVGVIAASTPAIDVDILDPDIAQRMSDEIDRIFAGQSLMTRTGMAPKFLVPFRSDTPFRKMSSAIYTDGKNEHKVEILGDGQQWVAYHVHPDTGKPYQWWNGLDDAGIISETRDGLPLLGRSDAQLVIDAFERIASGLVESGKWSVKSQLGDMDRHEKDPADSDPFIDHAPPVGKSEPEVARLLRAHTNDDTSYEHWFQVLAAVHHELSDAGRDLAYEWSSSSSKHADEKFELTWNSLGRYTGRPVTLRSLLKGAKPEPALPPREPSKAAFVPAAQFASRQRVEWHIKHILPEKGLVVIYGDPGSSKSFFALDMVAHVARGIEWRGHRVRQSKVAYIAAEGVAGFGNRLAAYAKHHDISLDDLPVLVRGGAMDLKTEFLDISEQVNAIGDVGIVVIDTLAAVTPGSNENTSEDMGAAIDAAQRIIESTGATVILIHHTNKMGDIRGWSGFGAAVDNKIRIERKDDVRTAHIEKQKEGRDGQAFGYRLVVVDLYVDEDGDTVTSCAVDPCAEEAPNTRKAKKERKPRAGDFETSDNFRVGRAYLKTLTEVFRKTGKKEISVKEAITFIQGSLTHNPDELENYPHPSNVKKTLTSLADVSKISMLLGRISLPEDWSDVSEASDAT